MITVHITSQQFNASESDPEMGIWDITYVAETNTGTYSAPYRIEGKFNLSENEMGDIIASLFE